MANHQENLLRHLSDVGMNIIVIGNDPDKNIFLFNSITYPEKTQMSESLLLRFQGINITEFINGHIAHNIIESSLLEITTKITKLVENNLMLNYVFSNHYCFYVIKK